MIQQISTKSAKKLVETGKFKFNVNGMGVDSISIQGEQVGAHIATKVEFGWLVDTEFLSEDSEFRKITEEAVNEILNEK